MRSEREDESERRPLFKGEENAASGKNPAVADLTGK